MIDPRPPVDDFSIVADRAPADERTLILKQGETFAIYDHLGDIQPVGLGEQGLYHDGTRHLSTLGFRLGRHRPLYLGSTVTDDNALLVVDLTNPDITEGDTITVPRDSVHIARERFLWNGACHERITLRNHGMRAAPLTFTLTFKADFADIFEVRGIKRARRGRLLEPLVSEDSVVLAYEGLDGVVRRTSLICAPAPTWITGSALHVELGLAPGAAVTYHVVVSCEVGEMAPPLMGHAAAWAARQTALRRLAAEECRVDSSNEQFNRWVSRSAVDGHMLLTATPHGWYPYAGVPWFSTAFGRDGIITALELLWVNPALARGVLSFLASNQATDFDVRRDAEPGKILHEMRGGEMAALDEVPFGRYYGSVDSTPLFVMLAGAYHERTGDRAFIEALWPNIERALDWIDTHGDGDGDGFVEYARQASGGLVQQGWKDSHDSVFHADGVLAEAPIALCEVQAYVFAAKRHAARLAALLGHAARANALERQAEALQIAFERAFWCDDLGTYALALDGQKRPCRVRSSNAGHCLFAGIASQAHAERIAETLRGPAFATGWGIRTLASTEARYNPMSYHNGSVWPHDNALIAAGLAAYGHKEEVLTIVSALFDASQFVDLHRLPELYCGFERRSGQGPILYSVACAPQAWAAGAVYLLLQSCLGLTIDGPVPRVRFRHPRLPEALDRVTLTNLRVGAAEIDLVLQRAGDGVTIAVPRKVGHVEIISEY